jgi:hypothetical protein
MGDNTDATYMLNDQNDGQLNIMIESTKEGGRGFFPKREKKKVFDKKQSERPPVAGRPETAKKQAGLATSKSQRRIENDPRNR